MSGPDAADVAKLTYLLDLLEGFGSNEQRARYLLSSDWFRDRDRDQHRRGGEGTLPAGSHPVKRSGA